MGALWSEPILEYYKALTDQASGLYQFLGAKSSAFMGTLVSTSYGALKALPDEASGRCRFWSTYRLGLNGTLV